MRKVLVPLICLGLFLGGWLGALALAGQASSPPPVNAPTHVGQQTQWHQATDQALLGGCRSWDGSVVPCTAVVPVSFTPSDISGFEYLLWAFGSVTNAAYWECSANASYDQSTYSLTYDDCFGLLTWLGAYTDPLLNLAKAYNCWIEFDFTFGGQYLGWHVGAM